METKYLLKCQKCSKAYNEFSDWFETNQVCSCGSNWVNVEYKEINKLVNYLNKPVSRDDIWKYFDFLPLNKPENMVSGGEGAVPVDRWEFLESYAKRAYGINCNVYAHRNDCNYATGTFKDLAGSVVASVLKEQGVKNYVAFSTGNIGVAFARYLTAAGVNLYVFIPEDSPLTQEAEIACFGQKVFRVKGDYSKAKVIAEEFARKNNFLMVGGTFDPMRIEAKKTMAYDYFMKMDKFPSVYIQALSGGTGPLGIYKGCQELIEQGLIEKHPRHLLVQSNKCAPMAQAWERAKTKGFEKGWEHEYSIIESPKSDIPTLATGNPKAYPEISKLVYETNGEILEFNEDRAKHIARLVAFEVSVRIGPAAAIGVGGFFSSLEKGLIKQGDNVLINVGEGIRRSQNFLKSLLLEKEIVNSVDDCYLHDREELRTLLWKKIKENSN